jgi:hypothetical protein
MKDFSIKDFLIHILHGGIVVAVAFIALTDCKFMQSVQNFITSLQFDETATGISVFGVSVLLAICYLIGLIIDPIADLIHTHIYVWRIPTFYLLQKGECWRLRQPYYKKIRKLLSDDILDNSRGDEEYPEIKTEVETKSKCRLVCEKIATVVTKIITTIFPCLKKKPKETPAKIWDNEDDAMRVYNYAKFRAFSCGDANQIKRIETYSMLFIFYRNMTWTTFVSMIILFFSKPNFCQCLIILFASVALMTIFYLVSYKYRTYYCREVLNAAYYSEIK